MKLMALDLEDLEVVSALMQDALLKTADIRYLPEEKRLLLSVNRFAWEEENKRQSQHERHRSALILSEVTSLRSKGIDQGDKENILSLLSIDFVAGEAPAGEVVFTFAAGASLSASVSCIEAQVADLGAAWQTAHKPNHFL
ncbi:DUF2948 family protein [Polycladidibacter hongkongensis]|uniref:DUF2948 family protein n=1 Tax=Polycladidibacter hongkongensis TaxID=1647556 RepID=UPI00082AD987|nr:DUF2948 family protein [Pseudovibrio hongkongensis]